MQHYIDKLLTRMNNNNGLTKMRNTKNTVEKEEDINGETTWQNENNTRY